MGPTLVPYQSPKWEKKRFHPILAWLHECNWLCKYQLNLRDTFFTPNPPPGDAHINKASVLEMPRQ